MNDAFDIAAGGMAVQRAEMDVIAANIAHADTPADDRYTPQRLVLEPASSFSDTMDFALAGDGAAAADFSFALDDFEAAPQGVRVAGIVPADAADSGADPIGQMMSLVAAGRAYDADVSALQAAKQMDVEAADIERT